MNPPTIEIGRERTCDGGWIFEVYLRGGGPDADPQISSVRLSWPDYELWSHGIHPPARVVEVLLSFLLERLPAQEIGEKFDAARIRRSYPEIDKLLPTML